MPEVNEILLQLFQAHEVEAVPQGEWVSFPTHNMRASALVVKETQHQAGRSVQLDVRLELAPGRVLLESFAGVGETREKAVADALHNFSVNTLHVLLAALFGSADQQVSQEEWSVGGRKSRVTLGNVGIRGKPPVQGQALLSWFEPFEARVKEQRLRPGVHWVRLYYGQMDGKALACEVLLDNDVWEDIQSEMAAFAWPSGPEFYSVRIFLILQVERGGSVSPDEAVAWLADLLAPQEKTTEDEVYAALAEVGIPDRLADRAYKFTQIAWGRALLAKLRVQFSPSYVCFNASGEVVESGKLADEPCFAAASRLAERYLSTPGFRWLALASADFHAVNNALHNGSKLENLVTAPAFLFLEAPTAAGLEQAQRNMAQQVAALRQPTKSG